MRNYQCKNKNPYKLPHNLYMQTLYFIRDYQRIKSERDEIIHSSPIRDEQPSEHSMSSPTENKAIKLSLLEDKCKAIEQNLKMIPEEYRKGVLDNIFYGTSYPITADYSTYSRWRQRFIYFVATSLGKI